MKKNDDVMEWGDWLEFVIYHVFHKYNVQTLTGQQTKLKRICLHELIKNPGLRDEIETDGQIEKFVIQKALENMAVAGRA